MAVSVSCGRVAATWYSESTRVSVKWVVGLEKGLWVVDLQVGRFRIYSLPESLIVVFSAAEILAFLA